VKLLKEFWISTFHVKRGRRKNDKLGRLKEVGEGHCIYSLACYNEKI